MGYYDDHVKKPEPPKKRGNWILPIIIGVVVGALLMLVIYPSLSGNMSF